MNIKNILVICVGNICRSPIGEALFAHKLLHLAPEIKVSSAGLHALVDHAADPTSQELMLERGIDISNHRARQITNDILFNSDLIFVMETRHQQQLEYTLPRLRGRIHRLGKWGQFDIPDPYRRPRLAFEQALTLIEQGIDEWQSRLFAKIAN